MGNQSFQGQVAVVTGAGGRLCSVIARDLAKKGCRVVLLDRSIQALEPVSAGIQEDGGTCLCLACDVTDEPAMQSIADQVQETFGPCRFLINGAGGNNNKAITSITQFHQEELSGHKPEGMTGYSTWISMS